MIPIGFNDGGQTSYNSGGTPLPDCISAEVTEELNGIYQLKIQYPTKALNELFPPAGVVNVIVSDANAVHKLDWFRVDKVERHPDVTDITANHISYDLKYIPFMWQRANDINALIYAINANAYMTGYLNHFTFSTNASTFYPTYVTFGPDSLYNVIMEAISPKHYVPLEMYRNQMSIMLLTQRGANRGVKLYEGIDYTINASGQEFADAYDAVMPYYMTTDIAGNKLANFLTEVVLRKSTNQLTPERAITRDFTDEMADVMTEENLRTVATDWLNWNGKYITRHGDITPHISSADKMQIDVGDTVWMSNSPTMQLSPEHRITKIVYDVLSERITEMAVGVPYSNAGDIIWTR